MRHRVHINEGATSVDETVATVQERFDYLVVEPLFKNGRLYEKDEVVNLDPVTAQRFIDLGELKEIK